MVGQEVLKALQRGWECWVPLQRTSKGQMDNVTRAGRLWRRGCYLGLICHGDGETSQNKNQGEAVEEWLYLSGNSRLELKKKKNSNSKLRGAKWCPKESRKEKESKCWDFPRQECFARPGAEGIQLPGET